MGQIDLTTIKMPKSVNETSGIEFYQNHLVTHNDSGDKAKLYIFTSST